MRSENPQTWRWVEIITLTSIKYSKPLLQKTNLLMACLIACALMLLAACAERVETGKEKEIYVAPGTVNCVNGETRECLLIKENFEDEWKIFYGEIEGFEYKEGYEYKLIVQSHVDQNPLSDNPVVRTRLVKILYEQAAGAAGSLETADSSGSTGLNWYKLQNAAYPMGRSAQKLNQNGESGRTVQLVNGEFSSKNSSRAENALTISLSPYRIYGDLDMDGIEEAVLVLVEESGTNRPFYKLIVMRNDGGIPIPAGGYPLGSALFIQEIKVLDGRIQVELREYSGDDPLCCPSIKRLMEFSLADSGLVKLSESEAAAASNLEVLESPEKWLDLQASKNLLQLERKIGFNGVEVFKLRGLAGQILDVRAISPFDTVLLSIIGEEDGEILLSIEEQKTYWSGELPSTQDYTIRSASVGAATDYLFEAIISGEGGRAVMIPPEPYWIPHEGKAVDVHEGPGIGFGVIGNLVPGEAIHITGKNLGVTAETRWWQVCCFDGNEGWVRDDQGEVVGETDDLTIPESSNMGTPEPLESDATVLTTTDQVLYFTFEDGPSSLEGTSKIMESLSSHQAGATFFITGEKASASKNLLEDIVDAGNSIGAQNLNSDTLTQSGREEFFQEIADTAGEIGSSARCLRPPHSTLDAVTRTAAAERGIDIKLWDIDAQDWNLDDPQAVAELVMEQVFPGARVLMHDSAETQPWAPEALDMLLEELSEAGYSFAPVCR